MERSESIGELAKALAKAQAAMTAASKDADNPHYKSRYADLPAIWEACRKPLTDNGLSVIQMPGETSEGRLTLTTMLLHASGEYISSTASTRLTKDDPQGVGSAITYLRRYALAAMVGIVADDDDDGNAASGIGSNGAARQQVQRPQNGARPQAPRSIPDVPVASEKQRAYIDFLLRELGWDNEHLATFAADRNMDVLTLTTKEARELIDAMKAINEGRAA